MRVFRDITNNPVNLIGSYPFDDLAQYDIVIFREAAALGRVGGPTLEVPIRALVEGGVSVLLWTGFSGLPDFSYKSDWVYAQEVYERFGQVTVTHNGDLAVQWPGLNGTYGIHLDPHAVQAEEYGPWLGSIAKRVGASGLLLDYIDRRSRPWTPPGYDPPIFATTSKGLAAFDDYRVRTIHWLREREELTIWANGRGPQIETSWYQGEGIQGCYWEQFGQMHSQGGAACKELQKMHHSRGQHILDPGTQPCWAEACEALLVGPAALEGS